MDFSKNTDLTIGDLDKRKIIPCGKKIKITCDLCEGYIICFIEDTISPCIVHNKTPNISAESD